MTPAMRVIRRALFLPVREAEEREKELQRTNHFLQCGRDINKTVRTRINESADELRQTYDKLLERSQ